MIQVAWEASTAGMSRFWSKLPARRSCAFGTIVGSEALVPPPSGGERRRVEIIRALATKPRFILLDEPFAGVDPLSVADLQQIIRGLKEKGLGILISDHNVRETLQVCDFAYIMNNGQILTSGVAEDIIQSSVARKMYLGDNFRM